MPSVRHLLHVNGSCWSVWRASSFQTWPTDKTSRVRRYCIAQREAERADRRNGSALNYVQKGCMTAAADQSSERVLLTRRGQLTKLPVKGDATLLKGKPATSRTDRTASAVHASATYKSAASGCSKDAAPADLIVTASCSGLQAQNLVIGSLSSVTAAPTRMARQPHNRNVALENWAYRHQCLSRQRMAHQSLEPCLRKYVGGFCAPTL